MKTSHSELIDKKGYFFHISSMRLIKLYIPLEWRRDAPHSDGDVKMFLFLWKCPGIRGRILYWQRRKQHRRCFYLCLSPNIRIWRSKIRNAKINALGNAEEQPSAGGN